MPLRRCIAFTLDLMWLALGGVAGCVVALVTVPVSDTIGSLGNVVVFALIAVLGCGVSWLALVGIVTFSGRSLGQRLAGLRYEQSSGRLQRAVHCLLAWLVPVSLLVLPPVSLDLLNEYRETALERWDRQHDWQRRYKAVVEAADDLRYAHRDDKLAPSEYLAQKQEFDQKRIQLERERSTVVRFAPAWLVQSSGALWLLLHGGLLCLYAIITLVLLARPPHVTVHDRVAGIGIVAS
jgi:hypothetical protein